MSLPDISVDKFKLSDALWQERDTVAGTRERLLALRSAVDAPTDLNECQWAQWFSVTMHFKPDLIIELGRGNGNSTALFTEAANRLPSTRVISFCLSDTWQMSTAEKLRKIVPDDWFRPLDAKVGELLTEENGVLLDNLIQKSSRVLLLWDAHGYEIAEFVLGRILPSLLKRNHLVLMHDISDLRYCPGLRAYGTQGLWHGGFDQGVSKPARFVIGNAVSNVSQLIAITDFCSRNNVELHSADHDVMTGLSDSHRTELAAAWCGMWAFPAHWHWFTIAPNEALTFPKWTPPADVELNSQTLDRQIARLTRELDIVHNSFFWKLREFLFRIFGRKTS